jgi:hypothetical protein
MDNIAKILRGPVGSTCKLSLERDIAGGEVSMYGTNMSAMTARSSTSMSSVLTSATLSGRRANIVVQIQRTKGWI